MRRLWYNGRVVSMDGEMARYEAIGTEEANIVFLGTDGDGLAQSWGEIRNLDGATVLPGFNDTHMHFLYYAMFQKNVSLFGAESIEDIASRCRARIEKDHPEYLLGVGWNQETMRDRYMPNRRDLDRISTEIPVCLLRACVHIGACNSVMLERIKALEGVPPEVMRHVDFENGMLREDALRLYMEVFPKEDDDFVRELIRIGQRDLNAAGFTCVHSDDLKMIGGMDPIHLVEIFRDMEKKGELTVRVYEQCLVDESVFPAFADIRSDPDDRIGLFRTGPRKLLQDGSLGAKSAEMIDGYADERDNHGIPIYTDAELCAQVKSAHDRHMDVAVHAIGDLALQQVCNAFEAAQRQNPWPEHRHGIVHAQITTPALLQRMKALGLQAYVQPIFIDADMDIIAKRVGENRARECYQWKTMEVMGIHISGGSDCPVEPFDVRDNLRSAITRQNRAGTKTYLPDQALSVEQAVRLFTSDAAWASRDEEVRGTLELGKQADLVVLDRDLFDTDPAAYREIKILETVLGGKTVYQA